MNINYEVFGIGLKQKDMLILQRKQSSPNLETFIEEYIMCKEKHVLDKKASKWGKHEFVITSLSQKMKWKDPDSPVNMRFWAQWSVKKAMLLDFGDRK